MNTTDDPANLIDALAPVAAFIGIEAAVCRADPSKCSYRLVNGEGSKAGTLQVVDPATLASVVAKRFKALDVQISEETGGGARHHGGARIATARVRQEREAGPFCGDLRRAG